MNDDSQMSWGEYDNDGRDDRPNTPDSNGAFRPSDDDGQVAIRRWVDCSG
jgi:hypothetical protein